MTRDGSITRRGLLVRLGSTTALGALGAVGLGACSSSKSASSGATGTTASGSRGGTLIEGYPTDIQTFNPWAAVESASFTVNGALYEGLLTLDANQNVIPALASAVPTPSADNKLVFHLRPDARWSDGSPVTADDVVFTYTLMIDDRYKDYSTAVGAAIKAAVKSISAQGPTTVVMQLAGPSPQFLSDYAVGGILPKAVLGAMTGAQLNKAPYFQKPTVTNGPFKFVNWQQGQQVTMARNEHYHTPTKLDGYIFRVFSSAEAIGTALQTGEVDVGVIDLSQTAALSHAPGLDLTPFSTGQVWTVFYQLRPGQSASPIFADATVRQALRYAVDTPALIKSVFFGNGSPATSPFRPSTWAFDPHVGTDVHYDPDKANSMLDQAGWKRSGSGVRSKDGKTMSFSMLTSTASSLYTDTVQVLQQQWKAVGAEVTVQSEPLNSVIAKVVTTHNFDTVMLPYQDSGDPDGTTIWWDSTQAENGGLNITGFQNPQADQLIKKARSVYPQAQRSRYYDELQALLVADAPADWLVYGRGQGGIRSTVAGFQWSQVAQQGFRPWWPDVSKSH